MVDSRRAPIVLDSMTLTCECRDGGRRVERQEGELLFGGCDGGVVSSWWHLGSGNDGKGHAGWRRQVQGQGYLGWSSQNVGEATAGHGGEYSQWK